MRIKHILADGRQLETIEGYTLPYNRATETAYRLLAEFWKGGGCIDADTQTKRRLEAHRGDETAKAAATH